MVKKREDVIFFIASSPIFFIRIAKEDKSMQWEAIREEIARTLPISIVTEKEIGLTDGEVCTCPFCGAKNRFTVSNALGQAICLAPLHGDQAKYDVVTFLAKKRNQTPKEVTYSLIKEYNLPYSLSDTEEEAELKKVNGLAATFFHENLLQNEEAKEYLKTRGLTEEDMIRFGLGYCGGKRNLREELRKKGVETESMVKAGLLGKSEKGYYDKFWERIMFPIIDEDKQVVGFGGRRTKVVQMKNGKENPKYLNSKETAIFHKGYRQYGINVAKDYLSHGVIVCEGYMDCISLQKAGFLNTIAPLGTALTKHAMEKLLDYTDTVYLAMDSDEAGTKSKLRVMQTLRGYGFKVLLPNLRPYKDPDELIQKEGKEGFVKVLKEAYTSFEFEVSCWLSSIDFEAEFLSRLTYVGEQDGRRYLLAYKKLTGKNFELKKEVKQEVYDSLKKETTLRQNHLDELTKLVVSFQ